MNKFRKIKSRMKWLLLTLLSVLMVISFTSVSYAEWSYGLGTGLFRLNIDGDIGLDTIQGAIQMDVDLDDDDISDLMESAFGLGGYATDGTWMIRFSFGHMALEGDGNGTLPNGLTTVNAELGFDVLGGEILVGYPVYQGSSFTVQLDGGVRYTKHEIDMDIVFAGVINAYTNMDIDESWTDFLIGGTVTVPFTKEWIWNTSANAGFGGSEGTYMGYTGLTWYFYKNWSGTLYGKYTAVDFENGSKGDTDWYLYDVDEFGLGINILYNF
jgi:hypothetical protein